MKKLLIFVVLVVAAIVLLSSVSKKGAEVVTEPITQGQEAIDLVKSVVDERNEAIQQQLQEIDGDEDAVDQADEIPQKAVTTAGSFVDYGSVDISSLQGDIVLSFSAFWCPSCRAFKKDIKASLPDIPSNLTVIDVNYDTERTLKKQYAVTTQHTFVQIDNQGNLIKKWRGGNTLESVVAEIE